MKNQLIIELQAVNIELARQRNVALTDCAIRSAELAIAKAENQELHIKLCDKTKED